MNNYRYIGCFVPAEQLFEQVQKLGKKRLGKIISTPHVTFAYRPESVDESLFGERILVRAVGYGSDGVNEGLLVELHTDNERLAGMAARLPVPHITLSLGPDGKAVNTRFLDFAPISPFELEGVFGGYDMRGNVVARRR